MRFALKHVVGLVVRLAVLAIIVVCSGCGGGGGASSSSGPPAAGDRSAVIAAASAKWTSIPHTDRAAAAAQMLAWMKTQTAFAEVGQSPDLTVYGIFPDGVAFALMNDDLPENGALSRSVLSAPTRGTRDVGVGPSVPAGTTAYLFHSFKQGNEGQSDIRPQLAAMLQKAGYTVVRGVGTLPDYQSIQAGSSALLWTNTHGANIIAGKGALRSAHFYMSSSTPFVKGDDMVGAAHYEDLRTGRLTIGTVPGEAPMYLFCGGWLINNAHFGQNSVWINNACDGFTPEMRDAAFHAGLSAYVAWDDAVLRLVANQAALYLVDRMSGTNLDPLHAPEPPQRPFDLASVIMEMAAQSPPLTVSNATGLVAKLQFAYNPFTGQQPGQYALLAPSIKFMSVVQGPSGAEQLQIYGEFGVQSGTVTLAGSDANLVSWTPGLVVISLPPASGSSGEAGDVQVTANGHKSNVVQLTEWPITFHQVDNFAYSGTQPNGGGVDTFSGTQTVNTDLKLWLRADVHQTRTFPGENQPFSDSQERSPTSAGTLLPFMDARFTGWSGSGTETIQSSNPDNPTEHDIITGNVGSPPVPLDHSDSRSGDNLLTGTYDPKANTLSLYFELTIDNFLKLSAQYVQQNGQTTTQTRTSIVSVMMGGVSPITFTLDASGAIQAGSRSLTMNGANVADAVNLSWPTATAVAGTAPDPNAARSAQVAVRR